MAKAYGDGTEVPVARSRAELEEILERYGASHTAFFNEPGRASVAFRIGDRNIRMTLRLPNKDGEEFTHATYGARGRQRRTAEGQQTAWEKACRRKWRALVLSVKAKLVSVEEGIETLEDAFMAHVVMPNGQTVGEQVKANIALAYRENRHIPLLPAPKGGGE